MTVQSWVIRTGPGGNAEIVNPSANPAWPSAERVARAVWLAAIVTGEVDLLLRRAPRARYLPDSLRCRWLAYEVLRQTHWDIPPDHIARALGMSGAAFADFAAGRGLEAGWWTPKGAWALFAVLARRNDDRPLHVLAGELFLFWTKARLG